MTFFRVEVFAQGGDKITAARCRESRRVIAGSIEIYYIEYPETYGMITIDMLLRSGALSEMPYCPKSGEYSIDANGEVYCSAHHPNPALARLNPPPVEEKTPVIEGKTEGITDDPFINEEIIEDYGIIDETEIKEPIIVEKEKVQDKLVTAEDLGSFVKKGGSAASKVSSVDFSEIINENNEDEIEIDIESTTMSAYEYNLKGLEFADKLKFDSAIQYFQKALDLSPDSKIYLYNLALTYARSGNYELSKYNISRAFRLDPNNSRIKLLHKMVEKRFTIDKVK